MLSQKKKYNIFLSKILKNQYPKGGFTGDALSTTHNLSIVIISKITNVMNGLIGQSGKKTASDADVEAAVSMIFYDSADPIKDFAREACTKSKSSDSDGDEEKKKRTEKAGLIIPIARTEKFMMERLNVNRKTSTAAVYLAAVVEYVITELISQAMDETTASDRSRVTPRKIKIVIDKQDNVMFRRVFSDVLLAGGVTPDSKN